jgi:hypothetical protein
VGRSGTSKSRCGQGASASPPVLRGHITGQNERNALLVFLNGKIDVCHAKHQAVTIFYDKARNQLFLYHCKMRQDKLFKLPQPQLRRNRFPPLTPSHSGPPENWTLRDRSADEMKSSRPNANYLCVRGNPHNRHAAKRSRLSDEMPRQWRISVRAAVSAALTSPSAAATRSAACRIIDVRGVPATR